MLDRFPQGTSHPIPYLFKYGWLGVDVFFAISGFVICLVASKPAFNVSEFLIRRIFRLYPLWLLTLSLFAAGALLWRGPTPIETIGFFFYSATLLPTHGFPFYDIGWSLQHEMLFYVMAATIVPFIGVRGLVLVLCATTFANLMFDLPWDVPTFFQYHAEFLAGVLAYLALPYLQRIPWAFTTLVGVSLFWLFMLHWGDRALLPIALFFLIAGLGSIRIPHNLISMPLVSLGDASYSIYLIHPLVFLIAKSVTVVFHGAIWAEEPVRYAAIASTIFLSVLSWKFFERSFIRLGEIAASKRNFEAIPKPSASWSRSR